MYIPHLQPRPLALLSLSTRLVSQAPHKMQALRGTGTRLLAGVRQMGSAATTGTQESIWAKYYPKQTVAPEKSAQQLKKEMLGFLVLGRYSLLQRGSIGQCSLLAFKTGPPGWGRQVWRIGATPTCVLCSGPVGAAFMFYDFVVGLEEEHHVVIPPYPWMRIRRSPGALCVHLAEPPRSLACRRERDCFLAQLCCCFARSSTGWDDHQACTFVFTCFLGWPAMQLLH